VRHAEAVVFQVALEGTVTIHVDTPDERTLDVAGLDTIGAGD